MNETAAGMGYSVEYGVVRHVTADGPDDGLNLVAVLDFGGDDRIIEWLHFDARAALPAATRYEIRRASPWNFGRSFRLQWVHEEDMALVDDWIDPLKELWNDVGGYYLVSRALTPQKEAS